MAKEIFVFKGLFSRRFKCRIISYMLKTEVLENQLVKCFSILTGAIFFVPLLIINNILRPYILSKTIPFQIMVLALLIVWIFLLVIDFKKYRPKFNLVFVALTVFTLAVLLSSIFSLDFYRSFWGNAERTEGFVNLLYLYFFAVAVFSVLKSRPKTLNILVFTTLTASFLVSLYPILQRLSILRLLPGEQLVRPGGPLGNPTFLAGYLLVHIFLAIWFFFQNIIGSQKFRKILSWFAILFFLVDGVVFLWTQTRGSLIGAFLGVMAALFISLFMLPKKQKKWVAGILILAVVAVTLFFVFRPVIRDSVLVKKMPIIGRLAGISLNDGTTVSRLESWKWSLNWWLKRPILGAGQDMFYRVFDENYSADNMALMSERFDRAHNKYIDVLVMNGAIGLLAYLFLLTAAVIAAVRQIKKAQNLSLKIAWLSAVALFIAYFTHNFFVFDTPVNSLVFYFLLGWLMAVSIPTNAAQEEKDSRSAKEPEGKNKFPAERLIAGAILAIVVIGPIFYFTDYKPFQAGRLTYEAAAAPQEKIEEVFNFYRQAISQNTFISGETRRMWGDYWLRVLIYNRFQQPLADAETLKKYTSEVLAEMDRGYQKEAMADFYIYSANINTQLSGTAALAALDRQHYSEQEDKWFSLISQNWPKRTDFYTIYVEDQILKKNYDKAEAINSVMLKETPGFGRVIWLKAMIILARGVDINAALSLISQALSSGYNPPATNNILFSITPEFSLKNYSRLVEFLESLAAQESEGLDLTEAQVDNEMAQRLGRVQAIYGLLIQLRTDRQLVDVQMNLRRLVSYLEEALKYQPNNAEYWVKLAMAYGRLHEKDKAIAAAKETIRINPQFYQKDANSFIQIMENEDWSKIE